MKNLVVYYSRNGNTKTIAQEIAKAVNGELKQIELINDIHYVVAGFAASFRLKGKIKEIDFGVKDYDNVFICTPVWGGKSSTPINTFIYEQDFTGKNVFLFVTQFDKKTPYRVLDCISRRVKANGGKIIDYLFIRTDKKVPFTSDNVAKPIADWINKNKALI